MDKFRLLEASDIEVKVKQVKKNGAVLLLYKTARTDMDILDETVGSENWTNDYREIKGNLYCGIAIREGDAWTWKWDCGIESREDGEGNEKKGEASDAFKRAGFRWGIGRELYTAPFIWVPSEKMNILESNGKFRTFDTFSVEKIAYGDNRRISGLSILNNRTGKRGVCMGYELINEIGAKSALLDKAIGQLGARGRAYAQAERDYRVALRKAVLEARAEGTPVTIISDICRGDAEIARLRLERDIAQTVYESAREAIQGYKLQIRILDAQLEREWGRASRD